MSKVFLGGTCNGSIWRDEIIKHLNVDYFNPVVEDWTEECQANEENEKAHLCDIHLYVITCEMTGVFSIAEVIESAMTSGKVCILQVMPEGFSRAQMKSLNAVCRMVEKHGGFAWVDMSIKDTADTININYNR